MDRRPIASHLWSCLHEKGNHFADLHLSMINCLGRSLVLEWAFHLPISKISYCTIPLQSLLSDKPCRPAWKCCFIAGPALVLHAKLTSSLYQITSQWPYPKQILLFNTCGDIVPQVSRAAQLVDFTVAGVGYSPTSVMASSSDDYDALQQPRYGYGYGSDQQSSYQPYPFQDGYRPSSSYTLGYPAFFQQVPPPHTGYRDTMGWDRLTQADPRFPIVQIGIRD